MHKNEFRAYLSVHYLSPRTGKRLSRAVVSDTISRCARVERCFQIDLDKALRSGDPGLHRLAELIRADAKVVEGRRSETKYYFALFISAVRRYSEFIEFTKNPRLRSLTRQKRL